MKLGVTLIKLRRELLQVDELVNDHEISKKAQEKADSILNQAENVAVEIKLGAYDYVEDLVEQVEMAMRDTIEQANHHYSKFEHYIDQQIRVIAGNKEELQASRNHLAGKKD